MTYEIIDLGGLGGKTLKGTTEDGTVYWIPFDENNIDYQNYLQWLKDNP